MSLVNDAVILFLQNILSFVNEHHENKDKALVLSVMCDRGNAVILWCAGGKDGACLTDG